MGRTAFPWWFTLVGLIITSAVAPAADKVVFNRDVRPILSDRCFACHGPDDAKRESGLRLDRAADATAELSSGTRAIVLGKPDESELLARITSTEPDVVMPPPHLGKPVMPAEAAILRREDRTGLWRARHGDTCGGGQGEEAGTPRRPIAGFRFSARTADGSVIIGTAAGSHQRHPDPRIPAEGIVGRAVR